MLLNIVIWSIHGNAQAKPIKMFVISSVVLNLCQVFKKAFQYMICVCVQDRSRSNTDREF